MQIKHITRIIRGYKGCQKLIKKMLVEYIAPLLLVYILEI